MQLMLDSGAYSAWSKEGSIDIDAYASFCLEYGDSFDYIVNLDIIPGSPGKRIITKEEKEKAARGGWDNLQFLISKGIPKEKIIHVFHQGEDYSWLQRMVNELDYIGIAPDKSESTSSKIGWLDSCMKYVTGEDGMPLIKFHGFGVTTISILVKFPWYSVDSTSWVMYSRYGMILIPKTVQGKLNFLKTPIKVFISDKSPKRNIDGKHFNSLSDTYKKFLRQYFIERGFTRKQLSEDNSARDRFNLLYFLEIEKNLPEWPWPYRSHGLV